MPRRPDCGGPAPIAAVQAVHMLTWTIMGGPMKETHAAGAHRELGSGTAVYVTGIVTPKADT